MAPHAKTSTIGQAIDAALSYVGNVNSDGIRTHYLHTLEDITSRVGLDDLTTAELVSLTALLVPAHGRVLSGRGLSDDPARGGRLLNLIHSDPAV